MKEKDSTEKKDDIIRPIRWHYEDYQALEKHCERLGEKVSSYIKGVVLSDIGRKSRKTKKIIKPKVDRETLIEINKVGVNINQITKSINKGVYPSDDQLKHQLRTVLELIREIKTKI